MISEAQNFAMVATELDDIFYQKFAYDATYPSIATARTAEIFKPLETTHAAYIGEVFKGGGLFPSIGETQAVPSTTIKVANKYTIYIKDFADSREMSKDWFDDQLFGLYSAMVADLAQMARNTQDDNAFKLFRNGFTTSLTADGQPIFGTHTLLGGGTVVNFATGGGSALTDATLNTAIVSLREQKNQAGVVLGGTPKILLVPPKLFKTAILLTESALVADGTATNAINVYRSAYGITVYSSPYLGAASGGSDTAWYLLSENHAITRIVRQGIQTDLRNWSFSNNRTYLYQANFREEVFCPDYCGAYGAVGA